MIEQDKGMIDNGIDLWLWLLGGVSTAFAFVLHWIFNKLSNRVEVLEADVNILKQEIAVNTVADKMRHEAVMNKLSEIATKIALFDKNVNNFYSENPNLKRPKE